MAVIILLVSVPFYLVLWRIPFGKIATLCMLSLQMIYYAYSAVPTTSFYVHLIESNTGAEFVGDVHVIWDWASTPYGFPNIFSDRAIDVLIVSEETNVESIRKELRYSNDSCEISSAKASKLNGGGAMPHCWSGISSSGRDDIYLSASENYKTLYFFQR